MQKILKFFLFILFPLAVAEAQNVMWIDTVSAGSNQTVMFSVYVSNNQPFVAFQLDIFFPNVLSYINNSATLTSRSDGHILSANLIEPNKLRVIAYSLERKNFIGNNGSVLNFQCKTKFAPGYYSLQIQNPILADTGLQNILSGKYDGLFILLAPDIKIDIDSLDFGSIPLKQTSDRIISISNKGTVNLTVSKLSSSNFEIIFLDSSSQTISPNSSISRTVRFKPVVKGYKNGNLFIYSDDPDEPIKTVKFNAHSYAVNELRVNPSSGRSGYPIEITFSINNMESFVGFQFDLELPDVLTLIRDSVFLTSRKVDHIVSANMVSSNRLRVLAFSPTNKTFKDTIGNVLRILFFLKGTGGYYSLNIRNAIITDSTATNIISASYSSYVNILSPDIHCNSSIDFGEVSVLDTASVNLQVFNYGNDTLNITSIASNNPYFWNTTALPQKIVPYNYKYFVLKFYSPVKGIQSGKLTIRNNDPDEDPLYVNVSANSFNPNYIIIRDTSILSGDTLTLNVDVENYEPFVAFQFDLTFPDSLIYIANSAVLTNRKQDHSLFTNKLDEKTLRVIAFSINQAPFLGNNGSVLRLKLKAGFINGTFPVIISNALLVNSNSQNILKSARNGNITINIYTTQPNVLNQGWNMISTNLILADSTLDSIFTKIKSKLVLMKNGRGQVYWPEFGINTIGKWKIQDGYQVYLRSGDTLNFKGRRLDPQNFPINLNQGWNLIAYLRNNPLGIDTCLSGIVDKLVIAKNNYGQVYWPVYGINTIGPMLPGQGYQLYLSQPTILIYPSNELVIGNKINKQKSHYLSSNIPEHYITQFRNTGNNAILLIRSNELIDGDEIGIWDETGQLIGSGVANEKLVLVTIWGDDEFTKDIKEGAVENEKLKLTLWSIRDKKEKIVQEINLIDALSGNAVTSDLRYSKDAVLISDFQSNDNSFINDFVLFQNYPNPFNSRTKIRFVVPEKRGLFLGNNNKREKIFISLKIFDVLGNEIYNILNEEKSPGTYEVDFDASNLPSGVYIYQLMSNSIILSKKMIILK